MSTNPTTNPPPTPGNDAEQSMSRSTSGRSIMNHSRPYTFESRRGPHYLPHRSSSLGSSPPLPSSNASVAALGTTALHTGSGSNSSSPISGPGVKSSSASTTSSSRSRSPPLHPDEIFQPPSLADKSRSNNKAAAHMYNPAAAATVTTAPPTAYSNPYMYNYNPAVEDRYYGWGHEKGGLVDYSDPIHAAELLAHRRSKILSRSRFFLRVIATLCAIGVIAGLGSALAVFFDTRGDGLVWNGEPIWHPNIDKKPSNLLVGMGGACAVISTFMLSLSAWARIRHVTFLSNVLNLVISSLNIALAFFGAIFFVKYQGTREAPTFWHWVCDHGVDDPNVQFSMLCGEAKFSYGMAYAVVFVELLVVVNIVVGWVLLGKDGDGKKSGARGGAERTIVVQVKKAEKKQGQWKGGY
ncbi:hypothetical protein BDZ91DRAFT_791633 [Kalaharituber pfeilii]|nr:hypothetical protein BDZ91DRAFT_791633 [Kalaharituber pfeilii]